MNGVNRVNGFHFDYDSAFNDQIDSISNFDFLAFIDNWQRNFDRDFEPAASQFVCEAGLVGAFQQARTEHRVDLHRGIHNGACDFVDAIGMRPSRSSHVSCITDFPCVPL